MVILFVSMWIYVFNNSNILINKSNNSSNEELNFTSYKSEKLGFKLDIPKGYKVKEIDNSLLIESQEGVITTNRLFGFSNSVEEYLNDLSTKNHLLLNYLDNKHGFIVTKINYGIGIPEKYYYIKNIDTDTFVSISTSSPELYDELEQIAASFEYLGNSEN